MSADLEHIAIERLEAASEMSLMHTAADQLMRLEHRLQQSNAERDAVTKRMIELEKLLAEKETDNA